MTDERAREPGGLTDSRYEAVLDAAETYREALVVRFVAEVGLRPTELVRIRPRDVVQQRADPPRYLLSVPTADGGDVDRSAYLPTAVERELRRYVRSNDIADDEPIFSVTPRRLQMLVSEVAARAADRREEPALETVSTSSLRRFFARRALVDYDVNPRVVKTVGGWQSFEGLEPYLAAPTADEIVSAFDALERGESSANGSGVSGTTRRQRSSDELVGTILDATDRCAVFHLDADGYLERWHRSAARTFGHRGAEIVGTHVSVLYAPDADGTVSERILAAAIEEGGVERDVRHVRADGTRFRARNVVVPIRDEGSVEGLAVLVVDSSAVDDNDADADVDGDDGRAPDHRRLHLEIARRHRATTAALLEASTHEEIERGVCDALVESAGERDATVERGARRRPYAFAWISRNTLSERRDGSLTASGIADDEVDVVVSSLETRGIPIVDRESVPSRSVDGGPGRDGSPDRDRDRANGPADEPATGCTVVRGVDVPRHVLASSEADSTSPHVDRTSEGRLDSIEIAVATVPLRCGDTEYGTLVLGTTREDAFDEAEREWLETMGRQIGHAIAAVRRRTLLLSDRLVELEVRCRDERSFFVDAATSLDCRFELDSLVPIAESTHLYYVHLEGAAPADVFELAEDDPGIDDCRLIETYEDGWRVEFVVRGSSPTLTLIEYGATVVEAVVDDGVSRITAECAADADLRTILDGLRSAFPDSELVGKREVERSVQTVREFREGLEDRLTDRQEAALRAAYFGGYYDWPRESTAEEIADAMGITSPTLHNHLRKGQHELLRTFFDEASIDARTDDA